MITGLLWGASLLIRRAHDWERRNQQEMLAVETRVAAMRLPASYTEDQVSREHRRIRKTVPRETLILEGIKLEEKAANTWPWRIIRGIVGLPFLIFLGWLGYWFFLFLQSLWYLYFAWRF